MTQHCENCQSWRGDTGTYMEDCQDSNSPYYQQRTEFNQTCKCWRPKAIAPERDYSSDRASSGVISQDHINTIRDIWLGKSIVRERKPFKGTFIGTLSTSVAPRRIKAEAMEISYNYEDPDKPTIHVSGSAHIGPDFPLDGDEYTFYYPYGDALAECRGRMISFHPEDSGIRLSFEGYDFHIKYNSSSSIDFSDLTPAPVREIPEKLFGYPVDLTEIRDDTETDEELDDDEWETLDEEDEDQPEEQQNMPVTLTQEKVDLGQITLEVKVDTSALAQELRQFQEYLEYMTAWIIRIEDDLRAAGMIAEEDNDGLSPAGDFLAERLAKSVVYSTSFGLPIDLLSYMKP